MDFVHQAKEATEMLAGWLNAAYSGPGAQLAVMEEETRAREAKTLEAAIQALR